MICTTHGSVTNWRRIGWHRWVLGAGEGDLLRVTAVQGLLRSSVRITVQRDMPEPDGMLLCVISSFLCESTSI